MNTKFWLVILILGFGAFAHASGGGGDDDDDGPPIDIDIDADGGEGGDADANADAAADASANASGEQNVTFEGNRSPGRGYVGGGSSSSDHQKVRAFSGGWLTGMAAIRWDATDKELRALDRADNLRQRGQVDAADQLECSAKVMYKAVGGNREECVIMLAQHRESVAKNSERDAEQDVLIEALQQQLAEIYEKEIPEAQETHAEIRQEVQRVQRTTRAPARSNEIADLLAKYEADKQA